MQDMAWDQNQKFCDGLLNHIVAPLDPGGDISQLQMKLQIGCAVSLARRMFHYAKVTASEGVPKLWALLVSCLEEIGTGVELVSLPILKIWDATQLDLAEILLTDLSSSLVEYGGINPAAAGNRNLDGIEGGADMAK